MAKIKVLAFNGSPRKGGNTATLLAALAQGVTAAGGEIETVPVCDLNIQPCNACGGCDDSGECVLVDDMTELYDKITAADRVVLASPIYFYGITAQAKALVDRTQALWCRGRLPERPGPGRDDPSRRGLLLAACATKGAKVFDGAILTAKYAFDAMGFVHGGEFLVRGLEERLDAAARPEALRGAEEQGRKLVARLSA